MGQKVEVDGTGRDLKGGKALIGGTAYAIKKGRTLKDGTGYDVKLAPTLYRVTTGELSEFLGFSVGGIWQAANTSAEYEEGTNIIMSAGSIFGGLTVYVDGVAHGGTLSGGAYIYTLVLNSNVTIRSETLGSTIARFYVTTS